MSYRPYGPPQPLLIGYDPVRDLPADHLARLVEAVVEDAVPPQKRPVRPGQPGFDPRLCLKVLIYGYATGVRASRQLERLCRESLPYLFLTRGDTPGYRTLGTFRVEQTALLEKVWLELFAVAGAVGLRRVGRVVLDSSKLRAHASPEAVLTRTEFELVRDELTRILAEAAAVDAREDAEGAPGLTELGQPVPREQMRDILRRVRRQLRASSPRAARPADAPNEPADPDHPDHPEGPRLNRRGQSEPEDPVNAGEATSAEAATSARELAAAGEPAGGAPGDAAGAPSVGNPPAADPPAAGSRPTPKLSAAMRRQVEALRDALETALAAGAKFLCATDPEAPLMFGERERGVRASPSWGVAVDQGLLVAVETTQASNDNEGLESLLNAAAKHEPEGITAVTADSGYYRGDTLGPLLAAGLDVCVPDANTASDLHRGLPVGTTRAKSEGQVPLTYDPEANVYRCPEGRTLTRQGRRQEAGQTRTVYRTSEPCRPCPRAEECLRFPTAQHRTLRVGDYQELLQSALARFAEPEFQERYRQRGAAVETIFGFLRGTLGYRQWMLRGKERVRSEGQLFGLAYQFRKVHAAWSARK